MRSFASSSSLEAGERQVDVGDRLEVGQQAREQLVVPVAADLVEAEVEDAGLLERDVEEDDGHGLVAEPSGREQALVAADDDVVLAASQHRLDEAVLLQAPGQRFELLVGDSPRVRRVGPQLVDWHFFNRHRSAGLSLSCLSFLVLHAGAASALPCVHGRAASASGSGGSGGRSCLMHARSRAMGVSPS